MVSQLTIQIAPEEYLELERKSESRNEYLKGEVFAMTGASLGHNLIVVNIATELKQQLKQTDCKVLASDMRVSASGATLYTYPDVVVVCGEARLEDAQLDTLLNPCLLIEVLSKSTAAYDQQIKFAYYRTIESLAEYLLVAQDKHHITQHTKQADGRWLLSDIRGLESRIELASVPCTLALSDVYDRVASAN